LLPIKSTMCGSMTWW